MRYGVTMLAGALAGCGRAGEAGGGAGGAAAADGGALAAADFDPCSLLTAAEVAAITTDAVRATTRDGDTCYYRSDPDDGGIALKAMRTGGAAQMATMHRVANVLGGMGAAVADKGAAGADAAAMMKRDDTATPALGDEAAWGMNALLSVRKGDAFVEVTPPIMHDPATHSGYPLVGDAEKRRIAIAVATQALAKIGG